MSAVGEEVGRRFSQTAGNRRSRECIPNATVGLRLDVKSDGVTALRKRLYRR